MKNPYQKNTLYTYLFQKIIKFQKPFYLYNKKSLRTGIHNVIIISNTPVRFKREITQLLLSLQNNLMLSIFNNDLLF